VSRPSANEDVVRRFVAEASFVPAGSAGTSEARAALIHPAARADWVGELAILDHLDRRIEIEAVHERDDRVVAFLRVAYFWDESGELAYEKAPATLFVMEDGLIRGMATVQDRERGLALLDAAPEELPQPRP
jgi:hypothetical protein